jgi:hypothetical protein
MVSITGLPALGGEGGGRALEHRPGFDEVTGGRLVATQQGVEPLRGVAGAGRADVGAAPGHDLDQAALDQPPQRLAHHRPADAVTVGELALGWELGAGRRSPGEDLLLKVRGETRPGGREHCGLTGHSTVR